MFLFISVFMYAIREKKLHRFKNRLYINEMYLGNSVHES